MDADLRKLGVPSYPGGLMLRMLTLNSNIINRTKAVEAGHPPYNDGPDEHRALKCTDWPRLADMKPASFVDFYNKVTTIGAKYSLAMTPFDAINTKCEAIACSFLASASIVSHLMAAPLCPSLPKSFRPQVISKHTLRLSTAVSTMVSTSFSTCV